MADYAAFLASKRRDWRGHGVTPGPAPTWLWPFQRALRDWALRKGRAALFCDTGTGKTRMQVSWASEIPGRVLILAPLAVGEQTIREATSVGVTVGPLGAGARIEITNYERLHRITPSDYSGVVLDESSILKAYDGKTRTALIRAFEDTPYRLCCTATPAPNDSAELANHCEFLGVMKREEMLATFFVHDEDGWRLKGHAHQAFYRWLASWGMFLRRPSNLGFSDEGFELPALSIREVLVPHDGPTGSYLFAGMGGIGVTQTAATRRATLGARVQALAGLIKEDLAGCLRVRANDKPTGNGIGAIRKGSANGTAPTASPTSPGLLPPHDSVGNSAHLSTANGGSAKPTGSRKRSTSSAWPNSMVAARSAGDARAEKGSTDGCTSITTTTPAAIETCSADHVTAALDSSSMTRCSSSPPLSISSGMQWIIWCGLDDEERAIAAALGPIGIVINGKHDESARVEKLSRWLSGERPVLITKAAVFGWGMNFQNCHKMAFLGLGHSYELYYQAIRRCYRYGQTRPVDVFVVVSEAEHEIVRNVQRKEAEATRVAEGLLVAVREAELEEIRVTERQTEILTPTVEKGEAWTLYNGDAIETLGQLEPDSVDLSVYSPPFISLYTYTNSERDIGNCSTKAEFLEHFGYVVRELLRVTKPGRLSCCHIAQTATTKATHGVIGLTDLRGAVIEAFVANGWVYHGEVCIDKDPQAQAIRTHSKALLFVQLRKDASWLRPALADYILVFRRPGDNAVAIHPDISNDDWIEWARPIWYGIRESDTLNVREGRAEDDERHLVPLQLGTIERCVRLWSNKGETVLSPFAGIGSEGYEAVRLGRRFVGIELKPEYAATAVKNLRRAETMTRDQLGLFDGRNG